LVGGLLEGFIPLVRCPFIPLVGDFIPLVGGLTSLKKGLFDDGINQLPAPLLFFDQKDILLVDIG